ncbi:unnamed protein product [Ilex paraguariensis]|uniref:Protein FAM33A n=1 Tax=Ilex paraguariensis TaxID=185542 RepID=A0ABC8T2P4_9AQUA
MGHRHHHHLPETQHHQSVDGLVNLFTKGNHDLTVIQHKLEKEFQQIYPDSANPMKLVSRIKKVQEELSSMKEQCRELLAAKQVDVWLHFLEFWCYCTITPSLAVEKM